MPENIFFENFKLEFKPWESSILKRNVYNLNLEDNFNYGKIGYLANKLNEIEQTILTKQLPVMISTRIKTDNSTAVRLLENSGFRLMECYVRLKHNLKNIPCASGKNTIKDYNSKYIKLVTKIAQNSFTFSRFHFDENISKELADETRKSWVENSCKGRAEKIYISEKNEKITGFVICKVKNDEKQKICNLDLIAVDKQYRQQRIAYDLTIEFLKYAKNNNFGYAIVGTQAHNIPSLKLYEKTGFEISETFYTYHKHLKNK